MRSRTRQRPADHLRIVTSEVWAPGSASPARWGTTAVAMLLAAALAALLLAPLAMPATYSWTEHGVSESAGQAVEGAWVARSGFLLFGFGVLGVVAGRRHAWGAIGTVLHLLFGVSMFGVAAFSAKAWDDRPHVESEDLLHSIFATTMGFGFVLGVVAVMVARRLPTTRAALPDIAAAALPTIISLTMATPVWGLLQRVMFVIAAAWYGREMTIRPAVNDPP